MRPEPLNSFSLQRAYDMSLRVLHRDLCQAGEKGVEPDIADLAGQLVRKATEFDCMKLGFMLQKPYNSAVDRNFTAPVSYDDVNLKAALWADNRDRPLEPQEKWNAGRRSTNINICYELNEQGYPVNPYFDYGVTGRGVIGRFGPNHAVDNGVLRIMNNRQGQPRLHALGIIRNDNGLPALCGGFTNFVQGKDGRYPYTRKVALFSQASEFVEELVSGSVTLKSEFADGIEQEIADAILEQELSLGQKLAQNKKLALRNEIITHRKMRQIDAEDPGFLRRVYDAFDGAHECYAGPVLNSGRNTNNAWMETRLSWFMLDEERWDKIRGNNNYDFVAGDDAQAVLWHEITPDLVRGATGSHGAFFTYLLSSYLLTTKDRDEDRLAGIRQQAQELLTFLDNSVSRHVNDGPAPSA